MSTQSENKPNNQPFEVTLEADKEHWWCSCGRSQTQPFCDGAHQGTALVPRSIRVDERQTVWLCGRKGTHEAPFCDGSHNRL